MIQLAQSRAESLEHGLYARLVAELAVPPEHLRIHAHAWRRADELLLRRRCGADRAEHLAEQRIELRRDLRRLAALLAAAEARGAGQPAEQLEEPVELQRAWLGLRLGLGLGLGLGG